MIRREFLALGATATLALGAYVLLPRQMTAPVGDAILPPAQAAGEVEIPEMVLGEADAPVTVVEYASFTCPHCASFHANTFKKLRSDYIDTGKVKFIFREVYFDRFGLWAGMVARCGGEQRYFGMTDLIFSKQSEWTQGQPGDIVEGLKKIGLSAGLGQEQLDACLQDAEMAQALVAWYEENQKADNVRATPSFIIDGEPYSNMGYEEFAQILDEKLGE